MSKSNTICPDCMANDWHKLLDGGHSRHCACETCHGTGRVPATPTIKTGEQTWYKDGHHPTPDKCSNPDHEMLLPTGNVIHSDAKHRYDTPAPDTQPDPWAGLSPGEWTCWFRHGTDDCECGYDKAKLAKVAKSNTSPERVQIGGETEHDTQPGDELEQEIRSDIEDLLRHNSWKMKPWNVTSLVNYMVEREEEASEREQAAYTQGRRDLGNELLDAQSYAQWVIERQEPRHTDKAVVTVETILAALQEKSKDGK